MCVFAYNVLGYVCFALPQMYHRAFLVPFLISLLRLLFAFACASCCCFRHCVWTTQALACARTHGTTGGCGKWWFFSYTNAYIGKTYFYFQRSAMVSCDVQAYVHVPTLQIKRSGRERGTEGGHGNLQLSLVFAAATTHS